MQSFRPFPDHFVKEEEKEATSTICRKRGKEAAIINPQQQQLTGKRTWSTELGDF